jgi:hypothetical protein
MWARCPSLIGATDRANAVIASIRTDETGGTACAAEATTANSDIDEERPNTS